MEKKDLNSKIIIKDNEIVEIKVFDDKLYDALYDVFSDVLYHADVDPDDPTHIAAFYLEIDSTIIYVDLHKVKQK